MTKFIPARISDIAEIQKLAEKSWNSAYSDILSQEQIDYMLRKFYSEEELSKQMTKLPDYHYFLIENSGEICGFTGFQHNFEKNTTKLHRLYLLPETKGKGIGKSALDFIVKGSENFGNNRIILNVNKENSAKSFYEKFGFQIYDEVILDIENGFVMDDFLMQYAIH